MPRPRPIDAEIVAMAAGDFLLKVIEGPIFFNVKLRREDVDKLVKSGQNALERSDG